MAAGGRMEDDDDDAAASAALRFLVVGGILARRRRRVPNGGTFDNLFIFVYYEIYSGPLPFPGEELFSARQEGVELRIEFGFGWSVRQVRSRALVCQVSVGVTVRAAGWVGASERRAWTV